MANEYAPKPVGLPYADIAPGAIARIVTHPKKLYGRNAKIGKALYVVASVRKLRSGWFRLRLKPQVS